MRRSELFSPTRKDVSDDIETASHRLMLRGGYFRQISAGLHAYLPLADRVLHNIERIIDEEMMRAGVSKIRTPIVQPLGFWEESGRATKFGDEMVRFSGRGGEHYTLGPTHEEIMVSIVRQDLQSHRDLPIILYQIGNKFRDEMRPRHGPIRAREFYMQDAYSFDLDESGLDASYERMREAYRAIFDRFGLSVYPVVADSGEMGGRFSEELVAPAAAGEEWFKLHGETLLPADTGEEESFKGIEVAHLFKLGRSYSETMNLRVTDTQGSPRVPVMGSYGIGVSRSLAAIIEQHHTENGPVWPAEVSPFELVMIGLGKNSTVVESLYTHMRERNVDVLYDDRPVNAGVKFADAELIGAPTTIVVGSRADSEGVVEVRERSHQFDMPIDNVIEYLSR